MGTHRPYHSTTLGKLIYELSTRFEHSGEEKWPSYTNTYTGPAPADSSVREATAWNFRLLLDSLEGGE